MVRVEHGIFEICFFADEWGFPLRFFKVYLMVDEVTGYVRN